jgi:OmpA-OmpF porin, OOP family
MNKSVLFTLLLLVSFTSFSQITIFKRVENDTLNRWSIDLNVGQSKGIAPYTTGYFSSNPDKYFGSFAFNHVELGARYMFSPKFGFKFGGTWDLLKNNAQTASLPFKIQVLHASFEGVVNLSRLFEVDKSFDRLGLLFHGGIDVSSMTPMYGGLNIGTANPQNNNITEYNGGVKSGITPTYRIANKVAIMADVSFITNYRQHLSWDGFYANDSNNLGGSMISYTLGLTVGLGDGDLHGDWAKIPSVKADLDKALEKRVGEIETLMNDSDKDGVPDYLDQENNSTAGVAVDTRGKMVDLNKNGVPDELERYMETKFVDKTNGGGDMVVKYINDGYVAAYFETNIDTPTDVSTQGIGFMLNYLRTNPTKSISIVGYADEVGDTEANKDLSNRRANNIKDILVKAKVSPERLHVIPSGEDKTVEIASDGARRLVRKVTFRVDK